MVNEFLKDGCFYRIMDDPTELISNQQGPASSRWKQLGMDFYQWADVIAAAKKPHPELIKSVNTMVDSLEDLEIPEPVSIKRHIRYREDRGDEVCLDRLRGGQEYWRSSERSQAYGQQTKRIFIDMAAPIKYSTTDIQWRSVAGIVLTHLLEKAGYQVELWAVSHCSNAYKNNEDHLIAVKLKDYDGMLDLSSLCTFTSGWCYRSLWFSNKKRNTIDLKSTLGEPTYAHGYTLSTGTGVEFSTENDIYLYKLFSSYAAVSKVKEVLGHYQPQEEEEEEEPWSPPAKSESKETEVVETFQEKKARLKAEAKAAKEWEAYWKKQQKLNVEN